MRQLSKSVVPQAGQAVKRRKIISGLSLKPKSNPKRPKYLTIGYLRFSILGIMGRYLIVGYLDP